MSYSLYPRPLTFGKQKEQTQSQGSLSKSYCMPCHIVLSLIWHLDHLNTRSPGSSVCIVIGKEICLLLELYQMCDPQPRVFDWYKGSGWGWGSFDGSNVAVAWYWLLSATFELDDLWGQSVPSPSAWCLIKHKTSFMFPCQRVSEIHSVVSRHVHGFFQNEFSTRCDLGHPLSIYSILLFP